jgi:hypothetical protein
MDYVKLSTFLYVRSKIVVIPSKLNSLGLHLYGTPGFVYFLNKGRKAIYSLIFIQIKKLLMRFKNKDVSINLVLFPI